MLSLASKKFANINKNVFFPLVNFNKTSWLHCFESVQFTETPFQTVHTIYLHENTGFN